MDKSEETGAGAQTPVETDGYEDGYGEGYGEGYDEWWYWLKKEEVDDPEDTTVKDVSDLGGHEGHDALEEIEVEPEPPMEMERPRKKVRTPDEEAGDSSWQGWQSYSRHAGSSRDTCNDDWWQGGGGPWKNTWWWDTQWSDRDWKDHDRNRSNSKGKGGRKGYSAKQQHAPWAFSTPKGKGKKKGRGKVDDHGGQYVSGGYHAPDGTFYPYLVSNLTSFLLIVL